jgi:hypothetical protein
MGQYRKVYIAVICESDDELRTVQKVAEDISTTFRLTAKDLIAIHPTIKANGQLIGSAVRTIAKEGMSGVMKVIPQLMKMRR